MSVLQTAQALGTAQVSDSNEAAMHGLMCAQHCQNRVLQTSCHPLLLLTDIVHTIVATHNGRLQAHRPISS